jgi:hypothetical protein
VEIISNRSIGRIGSFVRCLRQCRIIAGIASHGILNLGEVAPQESCVLSVDEQTNRSDTAVDIIFPQYLYLSTVSLTKRRGFVGMCLYYLL